MMIHVGLSGDNKILFAMITMNLKKERISHTDLLVGEIYNICETYTRGKQRE